MIQLSDIEKKDIYFSFLALIFNKNWLVYLYLKKSVFLHYALSNYVSLLFFR